MVGNGQLGNNEFYKGERISSIASSNGWFLKVGDEELAVVLWAHVVSDQRQGDLGRIVGLVDDKGQLRPADKVSNSGGYVHRGQ